MLTLNKHIPRGRGLAAVLVKRAATLTLDWDTRQKSRFDAQDDQGRSLAVFTPRGTVLRGGDVLVAEDGSLVKIAAAAQPVLRITPCPAHGQGTDIARAAYHLGNRHVAVEVQADHLKIEPDPVLADMLRRMHLVVNEVAEAFEPEGGAYAAGGHGHGQAHEHEHEHDHGHPGHDHHGHEQHGHDHHDHDHPGHDHPGHEHGEHGHRH
jgi:urease accessory protein